MTQPAERATVVIAVLVSAVALHLASEFLIPVALALVLVGLLWPVVQRLARWHIPAPAGATITILGTVGILAVMVSALGPTVSDFADEIPKSIAAARPKIAAMSAAVSRLTGTQRPTTRPASKPSAKPAAIKHDSIGSDSVARSAADNSLRIDGAATDRGNAGTGVDSISIRADSGVRKSSASTGLSAQTALNGLNAPTASAGSNEPTTSVTLPGSTTSISNASPTPTASTTSTAETAGRSPAAQTSAQPLSLPSANPSSISYALGVAGSLIGEFIEVVLLALFILAAGAAWQKKLAESVDSPAKQKSAIETVGEMRAVVSRYVLVTALINVGQGVVVGIALKLLDYPSPMLWGVLTFVLEFVPYLGGMVVVALLTVAGLAAGRGFPAMFYGPAAYLAVTTLQNNVLSPIVYGNRMKLNPAAILLGLMLMYMMWGVAGAFLSVPLLAAFNVYASRTPSLKPINVFLSE